MHNPAAWLRPRRVLATLLLLGVALVAGVVSAGRAGAAPWGTSGADYNGVLCRVGTTDVPMGAWTVNGTVSAFSTVDVTGTGDQQSPAPVSGTPSTMTPGQAGFSQADIGAVAYLLARNDSGSAAELAELSADVALVAGSGQTQSQCLGQNGTSAGRAASRLATARRLAGPYVVDVAAQSGVIPGADAEITVTVRSASGAGAPGLDVSVAAGGTTATAVTGSNGVARTRVTVPAAAATTVTATVSVPTDLVYIASSPASVSAAPMTTVTGTTTLRPVLHPKPAVTVSGAELALSGGTVRPVANVTGTFGYSGNGDITLRGPVTAAAGKPCSTVSADALARAAVRWQDTFTFRGDAQYRASETPGLSPGCYGLQSTVTTTNSSPPVQARSQVAGLTVATLQLSSTAATVAAPGGLAAAVTGTNPGGATVTTTVEARGPLAIRNASCRGDFADAPIAGTSKATPLRSTAGKLRATVAVPDVRTPGCYALTTRNEVKLDGRTATGATPDAAPSTTAILRPSVVVASNAVSGERGKPVPGTVQVSGTFGFPGVVAVGVVPGTTIPISGCRDAMFTAGVMPQSTTRIATRSDAAYAFRAPAPARSACYALTATFTLTGNPAVTATSGSPDDASVFLAGIRPDAGVGSVVQTTSAQSIARAVITYAVAGLLVLAAAAALVVRTIAQERGSAPGRPLFRWRPNRDDDTVDTVVVRRPLPGRGTRPQPRPR